MDNQQGANPRGLPGPSSYRWRRTVASQSLHRTSRANLLSRRGVPPCRLGDPPELRRKLTSADERFHTFSEAGADLCFGDEGITRVGGALAGPGQISLSSQP